LSEGRRDDPDWRDRLRLLAEEDHTRGLSVSPIILILVGPESEREGAGSAWVRWFADGRANRGNGMI
jgi:hypothetical protein